MDLRTRKAHLFGDGHRERPTRRLQDARTCQSEEPTRIVEHYLVLSQDVSGDESLRPPRSSLREKVVRPGNHEDSVLDHREGEVSQEGRRRVKSCRKLPSLLLPGLTPLQSEIAGQRLGEKQTAASGVDPESSLTFRSVESLKRQIDEDAAPFEKKRDRRRIRRSHLSGP